MLAPLAYVIPMAWARRRFWSKEARGPQARVTPDEARWLNWPRIARGRSYYGRAVRALTRLEIIAQARGLTLPATIVHGSDDPVLPPAAATELHQALRGSKLTFVPGAQHSLFFTHHEAVNAAVAAFLREMSQGDLTAETQRTQRTADTR
jgi:pimeloyl-ACP methyl ester carboxylesterase